MAGQNMKMLRGLPSVDTLLNTPRVRELLGTAPRAVVADALRDALNRLRESILSNKTTKTDSEQIAEQIAAEACITVAEKMGPHYRKVINATGIVLHTGLGRAVLAEAAIEQIHRQLGGYSLLQVDIESGERSQRDECIEQLLRKLTGAEAATVVNNNAAATAIVLNTIAKGRQVIVSRGQLVEIGGSFRLPEVMAFSGAKLVEVGTTNRTHPRDYEDAINENTAAILRVHPSNYRIQGFSSEVSLNALVEIAHRNGLVMVDDVGAGALVDFSKFGFEPEPTLPESIRAGADIVTCSGDKLIGSSQAGIILGKAQYIKAIRKNQFARIVRVGKLTLAALEATLKLFLDEDESVKSVPTLQMLSRSQSDIASEAQRIVKALKERDIKAAVTIEEGFSQMGSGSLPTQNIRTTLVTIEPLNMKVDVLAKRLRSFRVPIFARIHKEKLLLDARTIRDGESEIIVEALAEILCSGNQDK